MIQFTLYNISFSLSMPEKQHNPSIAYQNSPIFHPCNYIYIYCMCFLCLFCFLFLDPIYTHTKKNPVFVPLFLSLSLSLYLPLIHTQNIHSLYTFKTPSIAPPPGILYTRLWSHSPSISTSLALYFFVCLFLLP